MERLIKIGNVVKKKSSEFEKSKIGLGFEKFDRGVFDPEKVYLITSNLIKNQLDFFLLL